MSGDRRATGPDTPRHLDSVSCHPHVLVFPDPQNQPVQVSQSPVIASVPLPVGRDLCAPPLGIGFRGDRVLGTAVPEASVDLNCDLRPAKNDVGSSRKTTNVDTVSEATSMQLRPKISLGASSCRRQVRHERGDLLRRRRRLHVTHG